MPPDPRAKFSSELRSALQDDTLVKLTLGKPRLHGADLRNVYVRPVTLKSGKQFSFVYRHATRDITKNHSIEAAANEVDRLLSDDFLDAHLSTTAQQAQLEIQSNGARLRIKQTDITAMVGEHNKSRHYLIPTNSPWLKALGITNDRDQPREGMAGKLRQIQKFAELIAQITTEVDLPPERPWRIADMGCGKGYLTFALAALLENRAEVTGIERRADLVRLCNQTAHACGFAKLNFVVGDIGSTALNAPDLLVALHACDTATDDALAQGIAAATRAIVVSPCCQKEVRRQLGTPSVLRDALRHGIFQERQAEFATDALRAMLLEWAGYRTKVFEFISTEHTAKNLMITATLGGPKHDDALANRIRAFAAFYGIQSHALATHLHFPLRPGAVSSTHTTQSTNS
ncbi:MAG: SAM-dependent methyltransferase [Opitutaceae bacterium]|nr:SAM-dependent methyltransferase [Opitutaceae bacterium]